VSVASDVPRLPVVVCPEPGESVQGFVRRLAEANGHRSMTVFLGALGLGGGFGSASADRGWGKLASATGLDDDQISRMRWHVRGRNPDGSGVVVAGARTTRGFVQCTNVRLCPSCVRENGIVRDFWQFAVVRACPCHGNLLAEACNCGRPLLRRMWKHVWECACGAVPADLDEVEAPAAALRVARNMAARIGTASGYACVNDLKAPFDALCAHDLMVLVHELGIVAATPASGDVPLRTSPLEKKKKQSPYRMGSADATSSLAVVLARLRAAMDIMEGWPATFAAMLEDVAGRNAAADDSTIAGTFATELGGRLLRPARGIDGLPLNVLRGEVERYWNDRHATKCRGRNPSTSDPTARRLHRSFNISHLAQAVGRSQGTTRLKRIMRRTLQTLSESDRALDDAGLARLVRDRAVSLHSAVAASLSARAATNAVEGRSSDISLKGWEHPQLMPADPALHGLRFANRPAYTRGAVGSVLTRLRTVARRIERSEGLLSLTFDTLREITTRWFTKTDLLLDILDGRLIVYTTVDEPTLGDLLVNADDLRRACSDRTLANRLSGNGGFAEYRQVNAVLRGTFGSAGQLTPNEFVRLSRAGLVRCRTERKAAAVGGERYTVCGYHMEDAAKFVSRRLGPAGLGAAEAAAFGRLDDIGPLLRALNSSGITTHRVGRELGQRGVKTEGGGVWTSKSVRRAVKRMEEGKVVLGLLSGPAFTQSVAAPGQAPVSARDASVRPSDGTAHRIRNPSARPRPQPRESGSDGSATAGTHEPSRSTQAA